MSIPIQAASQQQIEHLHESSNDLIKAITRKLRKRKGITEEQLAEIVKEAATWFIEKENAFENLRLNAPDLYESLTSVISIHATRLKFYGPPPEGSANQILREEMERLTSAFQTKLPNFSPSSAEQVALGTLAEWLMRCDLDFPPYDQVL